eukprot:6209710-Pleurochrysis_carterae.AAC.1
MRAASGHRRTVRDIEVTTPSHIGVPAFSTADPVVEQTTFVNAKPEAEGRPHPFVHDGSCGRPKVNTQANSQANTQIDARTN